MPFMSAFWDVLLADILSLGKFATLTLAVVTPAAGIVATLRSYRKKLLNRRAVTRATLRGASVGLLAAMVLGLLTNNYVLIAIVALTIAAFASSFAINQPTDARCSPHPGWLRFTLRQILIVQLVVAVLIVWWLATRQERIEQQRLALDFQRRKAEAESIFGPYWFTVVVSRNDHSIRLRRPGLRPGWNDNQPVNDDVLRLIARHPNVTRLDVASNAITDEGLSHLAKATQLKVIEIKSSQITNAGVESLCALPSIETIHIDSPNITPAVLPHMAQMKSLKVLEIGNSLVQDANGSDFRKARPDVNLSIWQWSGPVTSSPAPDEP